MFQAMLDHPCIHLMLGTDYRKVLHLLPWKHLVYTGPIDSFFDYRHGRLAWRSLRFEHLTVQPPPRQALVQPVCTVNHRNDHPYTRVTEFRHLTGQAQALSSLVYEIPQAEGEPYCPVPRAENATQFKRYESDAEQLSDVTFIGRLASYRYYNMDQVVGQALAVA